MQPAKILSLAAIAILSVSAPVHATTVIYEQSFTPGSGTAALNGTSLTTGASNWVAAAAFEADGDFNEPTAGSSATLSFAPSDGFVYTLDASIRNLTATVNVGAPENDWVALGFAKGQSSATSNSDRFINNNVIGKAWMLFRGADTTGTLDNFTHLGSATSGNNSGAVPSTSAAWTDATLATTYGGGIDMRVVLDTTGGTGNWTATWFAKLPASGTFTEVRGATALANEDINSVGVAISNPGFDGDLTYFSLTSIPEPTAALLGGLGALLLLRRRR